MENMERKQGVTEEVVTLKNEHDYVTIPVDRFSELIEAEVKLGIVKQTYETVESYDLQKQLSPLFGLPRKGDDDA